jgi:hypothetical protein
MMFDESDTNGRILYFHIYFTVFFPSMTVVYLNTGLQIKKHVPLNVLLSICIDEFSDVFSSVPVWVFGSTTWFY